MNFFQKLVNKTKEPAPLFTNWFRAFSVSGRPAGLAFECQRCHLTYSHDAPLEIRHCGTVEQAPPANQHESLPARRITVPGGKSMQIGGATVVEAFGMDDTPDVTYEQS
jgi:hypothetical protein